MQQHYLHIPAHSGAFLRGSFPDEPYRQVKALPDVIKKRTRLVELPPEAHAGGARAGSGIVYINPE